MKAEQKAKEKAEKLAAAAEKVSHLTFFNYNVISMMLLKRLTSILMSRFQIGPCKSKFCIFISCTAGL